MICNIFSHSVDLSLHSLDSILWYTNVLNFDEVWFIIVFFYCLCFCVISKKLLTNTMLWKLFTVFFPNSFIVLAHICLGLWSIWISFCIWYKVRVKLPCFACNYSAVPASFIEKTVLSPIEWFGTLVENQLAYMWGFNSRLSRL